MDGTHQHGICQICCVKGQVPVTPWVQFHSFLIFARDGDYCVQLLATVLLPEGKCSRCSLSGGLVGSHRRSERSGGGIILPLQGIELQLFGCSARRRVTVQYAGCFLTFSVPHRKIQAPKNIFRPLKLETVVTEVTFHFTRTFVLSVRAFVIFVFCLAYFIGQL